MEINKKKTYEASMILTEQFAPHPTSVASAIEEIDKKTKDVKV